MIGSYRMNGAPVGHDAFQARALDPGASVMISACAGSGKTTLLVGRIVRTLLEGCEPDRILAVTFTRKAAAEVRTRLMDALRALALSDDPAALALLRRLALSREDAARLLPTARNLYEQVLAHPRGPTIATFHGWFWQLVRAAPAAAGAPLDATLSEANGTLSDEARLDWLGRLREPSRAALRAEFDALVTQIGERAVDDALQAALDRRVEMLAALDEPARADPSGCMAAAARRSEHAWVQLSQAVERFAASSGAAPPDARPVSHAQATGPGDRARIAAMLRGDDEIHRELARFARLFGVGGPAISALAAELDEARSLLDDATAGLEQARATVLGAVLTRGGTARSWKVGVGAPAAFAAAVEAAGGEAACHDAWQGLARRVARWGELVDELHALRVNARLMRLAADRIAHYQAFKQARGVVDFGDVELMAARLLRDDAIAASMQARLDARYEQLLFDEFQDTNALQWRIVSDWLSGYAGAGPRPAVFMVGDVRQAIYRFRRADSRVFEAARALLVQTFGATELATDTTWRIAPVVLDRIDACLAAFVGAGVHRRHATRRDVSGLAWRLPLADGEPDDQDESADEGVRARDAPQRQPDPDDSPPMRDWLAEPRRRDARDRHWVEGAAIARAIMAARERLATQGRTVRWRDVMVLARRRTHFARYEDALRAAGIPVTSDRSSGLLEQLEVADLLALLRWLCRPAEDVALVQVLKSPLFGIDDTTLAMLARERDGSWWQRLQRQTGCEAAAPLREARDQLHRWLNDAHRLPVHELLDRVLSDRDACARYAAAVPPSQRETVRANLHALLALALDLDGGRFPGLPTFLDAMRRMRRAGERDAPGEGVADEVDAVQLMTIHGAKGLEAEIVVLADANATPRGEQGWRPLVGWSPLERLPQHLSFVRGSRAHPSRAAWLDEEARLARAEEGNLLYVALTRARSGLIVSGTRSARASPDSWYARLEPIDLVDPDGGSKSSPLHAPPQPAHAPQPAAIAVAFRTRPGAVAPCADETGGEIVEAPGSEAQTEASRAGAEFVWRRFRPVVPAGGAPSDDAARRALGDTLGRCLEVLRQTRSADADADDAVAAAAIDARLRALLADAPIERRDRERLAVLARRLAALPAMGGHAGESIRSAGPVELYDARGDALRIDCRIELPDEDRLVDWRDALDASIRSRQPGGLPAAIASRDAGIARLAARRAAMAAACPGRRLRTVLVAPDALEAWVDVDLS